MKPWLLISAVLAGLLVGYWIGRISPREPSSDLAITALQVERERDRTKNLQSPDQDKRPDPRVGVITTPGELPDGPSPVVVLSRPDVTPAEGQQALLDRLHDVATQSPSPEITLSMKPGDSWHERAQRRLLAEAEDTAWAPSMENAITTFLSRHPVAKEFEIEYVECRTSQCQIRVTGFDEATGPSWQRVVQDMLREPWATFGQYANASGPSDGRFVIVQDLQRRQ